MSSIDEKRMYGDRREETVAYVASGQGVATVKVSGDQIGRFGLAHRCDARDVATADGRVYVATPAGVLVGPDEFESLGFGGAVAVAAEADETEGTVLAADEDGTVSRYRDGDWTALGTVDEVRAIDGEFVAASDGVYRVAGDGLTPAGLTDVTDVAADGVPLAATGTGLYRLGNGWLSEAEGEYVLVASDGAHDGQAHAATESDFFRYDGSDWTEVDLPVDDSVADVAYGEAVYAVTPSGTFLVDADPEATADGAGGWRSRSLGLTDVVALAVA